MWIVIQLTGIVSFATFVAWWRGVMLLDPMFFIPFACLPVMLVPPILSERRRRDPQMRELAQLWRAVLRSCAFVYLILVFSLIIVNLIFWRGVPLIPAWSVALVAVLLGLASTTVMAALTVHGLRRFSATAMKCVFRGVFLSVLLLYRAVPDVVDFAAERITVFGAVPASLILAVTAALLAVLLLLPLSRKSVLQTAVH